MSVIIRLQNLPWSANALDIRQYFQGLSIPEGGVHIVGGELGDAFIAFSTDEDARQAFNLNNGKIKGIQISLMLSSRTEMQKVIETARNQSMAAFMQTPTPRVNPPPVAPILPSVVPPAVVQDTRKEDINLKKDVKVDYKKDKRRSRSRSRERKDRDRSRDRDRGRDRRRRDRSRSRSRERRDRRRRDRSRSRDRARSKDRDYHRSGRVNDRGSPKEQQKEHQVVWEAPLPQEIQLQQPSAASILGAIPSLLAATAAKSLLEQQNNFQPNALRNNFNNRWLPTATHREPTFQPPDRLSLEDRFPDNRNRALPFENLNSFTRTTSVLTNRLASLIPLNNSNNNNRFLNENRERSERSSTARNENVVQPKNCCVQLHPFMGGFGEIRRFFLGLFIHNTGIKFVNDEFGKRTGVVYIKFAYPEGKERALSRSGGMLRNQIITVSHLDDEIFDGAVDRYQPNTSGSDDQDEVNSKLDTANFLNKIGLFTTLLVEDLPSYTKEQDILKMFSDYSLISIILINKPRKLTIAYVKFSNADDAKTALEAISKHSVDGKLVAVKPCSDEEFETVQKEQGTFEEPKRSNDLFKNSDVLFLSRLPLKTTDRDISDFFSDIGIMPTNIHMLTNDRGFVGDAYCEFSSIKDAKEALEKNGTPLGTSIVSVKSVERREMEEAIGTGQDEEDEEDLNDDPFERLRHEDNADDLNRIDRREMGLRDNKLGGRYDYKPPEKLLNQLFPPRLPNLRPNLLLNAMRPSFPPRNNFMPPIPRGPNFLGLGLRPRRFPPPPLPPHFQQHMNGNEDVFGPPGCTVLMENVPFKATVEEILEFFSGYEISPDNILRRYNPNGKPSGESKVIFKNSDDAYQAVHEKQEQKIRDRTVYLTLC
ncbi:RNA-binding protein 12 isoform X2 [Onthophagus taurus]|uniref:RNA-binding protein 12 isoform X2 n=1 Tax=Onthophagus taurus TaxID=166361 RepID=UPI0039BDD34B